MPHVSSFFLCNSVTAQSNGLLSVLDLGILAWQGGSFPFVVPVTAVVITEWERDDEAGQRAAAVTVHFGDVQIARDDIALTCNGPGSSTNVLSAPYFQAQQPGTYIVRFLIDGDEIASREISVSSVMPPL